MISSFKNIRFHIENRIIIYCPPVTLGHSMEVIWRSYLATGVLEIFSVSTHEIHNISYNHVCCYDPFISPSLRPGTYRTPTNPAKHSQFYEIKVSKETNYLSRDSYKRLFNFQSHFHWMLRCRVFLWVNTCVFGKMERKGNIDSDVGTEVSLFCLNSA